MALLTAGGFFCAFDLASCALHSEKSGVFAHADDRRLREGPLLYCICGENMVYQSVRVRCAGVCRTIEWGRDKDMKEFTVTDKNGEKRVETLLMSSEEFRALAERENLPYSSASDFV